jgi:hypothetical protein
MPYISVTIPAHTALGQTVDTTIDNRPARVTVIAEGVLRIEPDDLVYDCRRHQRRRPNDHSRDWWKDTVGSGLRNSTG